jgi:hypothetical protein
VPFARACPDERKGQFRTGAFRARPLTSGGGCLNATASSERDETTPPKGLAPARGAMNGGCKRHHATAPLGRARRFGEQPVPYDAEGDCSKHELIPPGGNRIERAASPGKRYRPCKPGDPDPWTRNLRMSVERIDQASGEAAQRIVAPEDPGTGGQRPDRDDEREMPKWSRTYPHGA